MSEKTYTKGELMAALSKMKEPDADDVEGGRRLNETDAMKIAFAGAEALVDALVCGKDARKSVVAKTAFVVLMAEFEGFMGGLGVAAEAEKIITPPGKVMRDAA